jgi:mannobiose 2-epimerase
MNTLLHVLEAYTNLLRAWPNPRLKQAQAGLLQAFLDHVINPQTHFTRLYLDYDWTSLSDHISFGHDIETSWLLVEAAEVLGSDSPAGRALIERTRQVAVQMAEAVYQQGLGQDGSVMHEGSPRGIHDDDRHWWCQAEGVVGFLNAYQISADEKYAQAALRIWDYIEDKMVDRQHGEWFKVLDRSGNPILGQVKTGPWEDPYHHSRACLEVIRRLQG